MMNLKVKEREMYRVWRMRNKVRLKEVSEYLGVCIDMICRWEKGERNFGKNQQALYDQFIAEYEYNKKMKRRKDAENMTPEEIQKITEQLIKDLEL